MKITIHRNSDAGLAVALLIYPAPMSLKLHDCVITKHFKDKTVQVNRSILDNENEVADLLFAIFCPEDVDIPLYLQNSQMLRLANDYGVAIHDKP